MSKISAEQLKERFLLLYREGAPDTVNPYTKIQIENFLDKTGTGLAKSPSAAFPDGLAGTIIPVTGNGLNYSDISGRLSLELPTDTLRFVGFITRDGQKPDNNLDPGDFYIVNVETAVISVNDWPGIDDAVESSITLTETRAGSNYRADTGTIPDLEGYDATNPNGGLKFSGDILGGRLASVSLTDGGSGYEVDKVVEVLTGLSGGGGSNGLVRITGVDASGTVTSLEVYAPGINFRLGSGELGPLAPKLAEGGSGTGLILTASVDGYGVPSDVTVVENGYGYQSGDIVTLDGYTNPNEAAEFEITIVGNSDVTVNLGDRVFYKKDGKFVVVPDVVAANSVLELLPNDPNLTYYFSDNPDPNHLILTIKEARLENGQYEDGLLSAADKEKLDNISNNAGQGRVYQLETDIEPNYLDPSDPASDTLPGIYPLDMIEYSMRDKTGNTDYDLETVGYRINLTSAQKKLVDENGDTISPRNRGIAFIAEPEEINDLIDNTTIGNAVSANTFINAEDTREYFTQKKFTTLPTYVDELPTSIGTLSIIGDTEVNPQGTTVLRARLEGSDLLPSEITYTWSVSGDTTALAEQVATGNSIYLDFNDNTAGQSVTVNVVVSDNTGTLPDISDSTTVNIVLAPAYIGLIDVVYPPLGYRAKAYEEVEYVINLGGDDTTNDIEFLVEDLDAAAYQIDHTPGEMTTKITFFESSTISAEDRNSHLVTIRAYSETAFDTDEVTDDGRKFRSTRVEAIVDVSLVNPTIVQTDATTPTVGGSTSYRVSYDGGADSADALFLFETDKVDQVETNRADIYNMLDGKDDTFINLQAEELEFALTPPITDFNFKLAAFEIVGDEDTTVQVYHDDGVALSLIKTLDVTTTKQVFTLADNDTILSESGYFVLTVSDPVQISRMIYDGADVIRYSADTIEADGANATITFNSPGDTKIMASVNYDDMVQNAELDVTLN